MTITGAGFMRRKLSPNVFRRLIDDPHRTSPARPSTGRTNPETTSGWLVWIAGGCLLGVLFTGCRSEQKSAPAVPVGNDRQDAMVASTAGGGTLLVALESRGLDAASQQLCCAGAIGETVTFDLRLTASGSAIAALGARVAALKSDDGLILPAAFEVFRVHLIQLDRWPGWHIRYVDPLDRPAEILDIVVPAAAPTGGLPTGAAPGQSVQVFAELDIPDTATAGVYASTVVITGGGETLLEIPLRLTVWPFKLPPQGEMTLLASVNIADLIERRGKRSVSAAVAMLQSHGLAPLLTHVYPVVKIDRMGGVAVDWSDYDDTIGVLMDGPPSDGRKAAWCRIPFDEFFSAGAFSSEPADATTYEVARRYLRSCAEHFAARDWLDRSFFEVPNGVGTSGVSAIRRWAGLARQADRRLRTLTSSFAHQGPVATWRDFVDSDVDKLIDIWCPPASCCDPTACSGAQQTWMGVDRPPYSGTVEVPADETFVRAIPWQARRYGVQQIHLGDALGPPSSADGAPADRFGLLYSGVPYGLGGPVASMRLKHLRRGLQDLAYLGRLESLGLDHVAATLVDTLTPYALTDAYRDHLADVRPCGWDRRPETWEQARLLMADQVLEAIQPPTVITRLPLESVLRWKQFMAGTRVVIIMVDGVRVRAAGPTGAFRVECSVTVENRTRVFVDGKLSFAGLPMGWQVSVPEHAITPIAPMGRRRVVLVADATSLAWNAEGVIELPIVFHSSDGKTHRATAWLCYIASQRCAGPVAIDGDLSDWTAGAGNVAAGFVPLSGRPSRDPSGVLPTRCMVSHDATHVYFGIRARLARPPGVSPTQSNVVDYDDLIPTGEELVEILIDPTGAGTHAPEDLYHIVITRAGAVFERGIGTHPPIGGRAVWPADIRYAARTVDEWWVIEISVPIDAFGDSARAGTIWGINFTRLDHHNQVYTTWSGARYNPYDPMSLGNLMLP